MLTFGFAQAADETAWPVVGQQGVVRFVIAPVEDARKRDAYARQIERLCQPDRSCFLNFYTNSTAAEATLPLPDAIDREATVVFRRSLKQGAELFMWSCRLQMGGEGCF